MKKLVIILIALLMGCTATGPNHSGAAAPSFDDALSNALASSSAPAEIKIVSISPDKSERLNGKSIIIAELEYRVDIENKDYKLEDMYIVPLTKNKKGPVRIYGSFPSEKYPITAPSGKMRIEFPLSHVWRLENLEKPITLRFGISHQKKLQGGFVFVDYIAETNSYSYK